MHVSDMYIKINIRQRKLGGANFRVTDLFMMQGGVKDFTSDDNRHQ